MGAAGVGLSAVAAHRVESSALATAATIMLIHCAASLALVAIAGSSRYARGWCAVAAVMLIGAGLFGGDIALNTLLGSHLFPLAAPTGGMLMIASWLLAAITGIAEMRSARR
jgi:uncharacterized membrane protein YgdD (TMEM256/DUF423 family)